MESDLLDKQTSAENNGNLSPEEKERQEQEWKDELVKTEEEVNTLKQVLSTKQHRVQELKRLLGLGVVATISKDVKETLTKLGDSDVMQKANLALKTAGERTSAALSTVGKKLEDVKNSEFVKSVEEKVGAAYDTVKRSTSMFAIEGEAKVGANKSGGATPGTETNTLLDDQQ